MVEDQTALAEGALEPGAVAFPSVSARFLTSPVALVSVIVVVGGFVRLYHYDALSMWSDEGLSVAYARLPWAAVLGLHGAYSPHPPLYFALLKLVMTVLPPVSAGRMISVFAGTMAIVVLYAMLARLLRPWAGIGAGLVLASNPLAIWYSQEARPYTLTLLLVLTSYLALAAFYQSGDRTWALAYGLSLVLAMYTEYSAIYALLPQAAVLVWQLWSRGRAALPLVIAAGVASLLFIPWIPQLFAYAGRTSQQAQFAVNVEKVKDVGLAILGLAGNGGYYWSSQAPPWDRWPTWQPLFLAGIGIALFLGLRAVHTRSRLASVLALCLLLGTCATAILIGLKYPGLTYRTVLYAVAGEAILVGAAPLASPRRLVVALGTVSLFICLILSGLTANTFAGAYKQQFRSLAADTATAARFRWPVLTYPAVTATLIDVYQPDVPLSPRWAVGPLGDLPPSVSRLHAPPALWFAYADGGFDGKALAELDRLGYARIIHSPYTGPLYLDLFVRSQARLGQPLAINSRFLGQSRAARGWTLPAGSAFSRRPGVTGRTLVLPSPRVGESAAVTGAPGEADHMYFLTFRARAASRAATMRAFLICSTSTGSFLNVAPNGGGATLPPDTVWHTVRTAVVCPAGTTWLRVDLRASGRSHILFRNVRLVGRAPDTVSGPGG